MALKDPDRGEDFPALRTPMRAAVFLLCVYAAMHLIVGVILHVATPPDAMAAGGQQAAPTPVSRADAPGTAADER